MWNEMKIIFYKETKNNKNDSISISRSILWLLDFKSIYIYKNIYISYFFWFCVINIYRRCEGVGRLLLHAPGDLISMQESTMQSAKIRKDGQTFLLPQLFIYFNALLNKTLNVFVKFGLNMTQPPLPQEKMQKSLEGATKRWKWNDFVPQSIKSFWFHLRLKLFLRLPCCHSMLYFSL